MLELDAIPRVGFNMEEAEAISFRLRQAADEFPLYTGTEKMELPPSRHWAIFPGETRVCFTKDVASEGKAEYHLSMSAPYGRVSDIVALALLRLFRAPLEKTVERPPIINPAVRHFSWPAEQVSLTKQH